MIKKYRSIPFEAVMVEKDFSNADEVIEFAKKCGCFDIEFNGSFIELKSPTGWGEEYICHFLFEYDFLCSSIDDGVEWWNYELFII